MSLLFVKQVVQLIRDDILPHAASMPKEFALKIMDILNRGSIHSATSDTFVGMYRNGYRCVISNPPDSFGVPTKPFH